MPYVIIIVMLAYGILNLRYASSELEKIPPALRFLFPNKIVGFFIFIPVPHAKKLMVTRIIIGIACLAVAGTIGYAFFV